MLLLYDPKFSVPIVLEFWFGILKDFGFPIPDDLVAPATQTAPTAE
jgi:hypothetical protein